MSLMMQNTDETDTLVTMLKRKKIDVTHLKDKVWYIYVVITGDLNTQVV